VGFKVLSKTVTLQLKWSLERAVTDAEAQVVKDAEARAKGEEDAPTEAGGTKNIEDAKSLLGDYAGVEITGLKSVPWKVTRELAKAAAEEDSAENIGRAEFLLREWLRGWNLETEDGGAIPIGEFGDLPMDLIMAMVGAVSMSMQGENELPKGS